eukprot:scaffold776_cov347-Pavlova_lutheri.AAC.113
MAAICALIALAMAPAGTLQIVKAEEAEPVGVGEHLETTVDPTNEAAEMHYEEQMKKGEKFSFQAEVARLMDIIIHSLYSKKDIFLRELISNASDALDKIRFLALTNPEMLGEGDQAKLEIKISLDKEKNVLSIRDTGIGMTKEDLVNNLGTIAKSGTSSFLEQMQKGGDMNLIGQFGVGFYSVYLVADYVEVVTKHNDDKQYIWASKADGNFVISEDTDGEPIGRGTQVNIFLKDDVQEYAQEQKVKDLIKKYSEFINFPIYLYTSKTVDVPSSDESEDSAEDEDVDVDEEESSSEEKKTETVWDWERQNDNVAVWLRSPGEVEQDEYNRFYKSLSGDFEDPLAQVHFKAEGDVEFRALVYLPQRMPETMRDDYFQSRQGLKLYVRRVFISDDFPDLLPRYLNFLKGLVDSDTLPLNVSRELLQQHSALKTIKKKLVRKFLDLLKKIADADKKVEADQEEVTEEAAEGEGASKEKESQYEKIWKEFGKALKMGVMEDTANRVRLAKLLRFYTSKSPDKLTGFEDYVERMKEGQKNIYFVAGTSQEELARSPFVENLLKKGYEVIYFTDPLDEYIAQSLQEFDDLKLMNASKEDLTLGDQGDKEKARDKKLKQMYKKLTKWWKDLIGASDIDGVKISKRLSTSPCVVVTSRYGYSANMQRIMQAQAMAGGVDAHMFGRKTLEINPFHPLVKELRSRIDQDNDDESAKATARLLWDTALLESGFVPEDTKSFANRVLGVMKQSLNIEAEAGLTDEEIEKQKEALDIEIEAEKIAEEAEKEETEAEELNFDDVEDDIAEEGHDASEL